jgi:hypothetical protein
MLKQKIIFFKVVIFLLFFLFTLHLSASFAFSLSARHHLINASRNFFQMLVAPLKGIFITGPKNIVSAYRYEAYEDDTPSKFFGIWRAPGEEVKGILDGLVKTIDYGRKFLWEVISIPFSD